ncbi:Fringe-like protein [Gracilaria domingensis]|nr:Fringe-like protein [Gracilaria domingensis]
MATSAPLSKPYLPRSLRRLFRTVRTEWHLFRARPLRRRPWTIPLILTVSCIACLYLLLRVLNVHFSRLRFREPRRDTIFTHRVHAFVPRPKDFDEVYNRRCSWLYAEFGARDGRHVEAFLTEGNEFLEEYMRATQSSVRAFCVAAFDADPLMAKPLNNIRAKKATKTAHFDVFTQLVPAATNGTEPVSFRAPNSMTQVGEAIDVRSFALKDFIDSITYPWEESGNDISRMNLAKGNGNLGTVVVRFNVLAFQEIYWYLELLEALDPAGVMCKKIDRLIINFERTDLGNNRQTLDIEDRDVVRDWDHIILPTPSRELDPRNGFEGIVKLAREMSNVEGCRTVVHVLDQSGNRVYPPILSERQVYYAVLAGQPTFDERVGAQTETWMTAVPQDRLTIFTNAPRNEDELKAARGRQVAVVQPNKPELEQRLSLMQSWSHLVRVRESWDRAMKDNPEIKWLALVDDDTFVFPGGLREYLTMFDHRMKFWGGSGEQARIDNGDSGMFAQWLRDVNKKFGGPHCYMENEDVPANLRGKRVEYSISKVLNGRKVMKKVSHMCEDAFCGMGCPAVPQGAAIFLSRALVQALRPHIEQCELDTTSLCKNCGSQRLYMCVNRYAGPARTLLMRGVCRAPWKLEHRLNFPFALTYHGFNRYRGTFLSTSSLHGDMVELWQLGKSVEESVKYGYVPSFLIPMQKISDLLGCHNQGTYVNGECITPNGIKFDSTDKHESKERALPRHHATDRNGSA